MKGYSGSGVGHSGNTAFKGYAGSGAGFAKTDVVGAAATISGTITPTVTEADIVSGGKTLILTLTGDTFLAAGTGPIGTTANTQAIIDGISAAASPTNGWNNEVRDTMSTSIVVRTSDTVATLTYTAVAAYDITSTETITATIPAQALTGGVGIVAAPTFTVTAVGGGATGTTLLKNRLLSNILLNRGLLS